MESRIFAGQRALGYVCNHIPVQIRYIKKHRDTFIICVVGKRFHTFSASKLHLYSTSEFHPSDITCLSVDSRHVITACKEEVRIFKRGVESDFVHKIPNLSQLLPFGELIVGVAKNVLTVFTLSGGEVYLELPFPKSSFEITSVAHPATYVNKILLGSRQGSIQLWNINSASKIYEFAGWDSPVLCMEQSPALDVFAFGLANGRIVIHNLKEDSILMKFQQEWGPVTSIAFRTEGQPLMITGSDLGHLAVWNLETQRIVAQKEDCHSGPITGMKAFPTEPLLVTSSPDNSLRLWVMDDESLTPRLLKFREGHGAPPNHIRFYGPSGSVILSAGKDSAIRSFSLEADFLNFSLGKASYKPKLAKKSHAHRAELVMPEIVEFDAEIAREGEWDSIVAVHQEEREVTTWSYHRKTNGTHRLLHERFQKNFKVQPTSVAVSACGNFCMIGYNTGHVDRFNIQSGLHRQTYGNPTAHDGPVVAVASDALNQRLFTAGGSDLRIWRFKNGTQLGKIEMPSKITRFLLNRDNSLGAVALSDFTVAIIDLDTRKTIRTYSGHKGTITDLAFSPDSRWLVSASEDSSVRVWDLRSACLIDAFKVPSVCRSLTFSPTGEFLATCHENDLGIFLWTNKTVYAPITLRSIPVDAEPETLKLPGIEADSDDILPESEEEPMETEYHSPDQLAEHFVTLSLLPDYRWKNLAKQDLIRERNKPKEALKLPEKVPFFLPTVSGLEGPKFDLSGVGKSEKADGKVSLMKLLADSSRFLRELRNVAETEEENWRKPFEMLREMNPSQVEAELRKLAPLNGGEYKLMKTFLKCVKKAVEDGREQELVMAYLELFVKLHLTEMEDEGVNGEFVELFREVHESCGRVTRTVEELLDQSLDVVTFLKHVGL